MADKFLIRCAVLIIAGLAAIAGVNAIVDPYSLFDSPRLAGFNAIKPDFVEHLRLTNIYVPARVRPTAIIIGTSRAGRGYSPDHPGWKGENCYNMAMPGIDAYETLRYFQHALALHPLKRALVNLDFRVFHAEGSLSPDFKEQRFAVDVENRPQLNWFAARLPDMAASLISSSALLDSLRVIRFQGWSKLTLSEKGQWLSLTDQFKHWQAFQQYTRNTWKRYGEFKARPFDITASLKPIARLLRLAHRQGVELHLVIPPSHAWHWETLRLSGLQPRFEDIKRALVLINQQEAQASGKTPYPLWDFSGYWGVAAEPVSRREDQEMAWFWEPVHFKVALGNRVLDRVLLNKSLDAEGEFGRRIDAANLEAHLADWRERQRRYQESHPEDIREIERIGQWMRAGASAK
jgi:hypothetical protein